MEELKPSISYLFVGGDIVAEGKGPKEVKDYVKEHYEPPKKNIKGYLVRITLNKERKEPIIVNCLEMTITPRFTMKSEDDDGFQTLKYSKSELDKYGFKMSHIKKLIKAIKDETVDFQNATINISQLLESKKPKVEELKIETPLKPSISYLFVGGDIVAEGKNLKDLKDHVKKTYNPPSKDIKGYFLRFKINKNDTNNLINITCSQITITPKLLIRPDEDDGFQTFIYTYNDYKKYGFKMSHIKKIIKAIKDESISFERNSIPISEIL